MAVNHNRFSQEGQRFRESLTYEEKLGNQLSECIKALNMNDINAMESTTRALQIMIPTRLMDEQYAQELLDLDQSWEEEKKQKVRAWKKTIQAAAGGCPDVIDKPSMRPDREYWEKTIFSTQNLFDRRNIGLKMQTVDSM